MDVSILIGKVIIPTDFHSIIFQRDGEKPPTSYICFLSESSCRLSLPHLVADTFGSSDFGGNPSVGGYQWHPADHFLMLRFVQTYLVAHPT